MFIFVSKLFIMLRIKEVLKEQGVTQIELAKELGLTPVGLNKMINGNPTIETLQKIASKLRVDVHNLFSSSTTKKKLKKIEYEVVTYDLFDQSSQQKFITNKSLHGWELVSVTQFIDKDGTPCFRFYLKRELN